MIDKTVDASTWPVNVHKTNFAEPEDLYSAVKPSERKGGEGYLFGGVMSLVMGLVTVVRLTKNMPRRLTEAAIYGGEAEKEETAIVSSQEYILNLGHMFVESQTYTSTDAATALEASRKVQSLLVIVEAFRLQMEARDNLMLFFNV